MNLPLTSIVLASNNSGKIIEFSNLFTPFNIKIIPQQNLNINEVDEPYFTFIENALTKARNASHQANLPAIADDSGICAVALENKPGIYSARFAGEAKSAKANNQKLTEMLREHNDKTVFYYCCLVFIRHANDPTPIIAEGKWFGQWTDIAKGKNGFGYDPHFYLPDLALTAAELSNTEKNKLSHRAIAFKHLLSQLMLN